MTKYVGFLRGINVGGSAILLMSELKTLSEKLGLKQVSTYIQSGNVVFESPLGESVVAKKLQDALKKKLGKDVPVAVRTILELSRILEMNPFHHMDPAKVGVMFFSQSVDKDFLTGVSTSTGEEVKPGKRE